MRGVTLVELLLASVLGLVVLLGIGQIDVTRITMGHDIRGFSVAQMEASYGLAHMVKQLEGADRVNASNLQLRIPPTNPADLDNAAMYRWQQYKYNAAARKIRFYDPADSCTMTVQFHDIDTLTITPDATDANTLVIAIESRAQFTGRPTTYTGQVTIRSGNAGVTTGLLPAGEGELPPGWDCP